MFLMYILLVVLMNHSRLIFLMLFGIMVLWLVRQQVPLGAKSENKNSVDFNLVITGFVGIKRKQPETQIKFIGVIHQSWEQWLNLRWNMNRRFQMLMSMLRNKFIISESYLTFTFYILAVVVPVLTDVNVFIINAIILSLSFFLFVLHEAD